MTDSDQLDRVAKAIADANRTFDGPSDPDSYYYSLAAAAISAMSPPPEQKASEEAMKRAEAFLAKVGVDKAFVPTDKYPATFVLRSIAPDLAALLDRVAEDERKACERITHCYEGLFDRAGHISKAILSRTGCPKETAE